MSEREFKPGDVALVRYRYSDGPEVVGIRTTPAGWRTQEHGYTTHADGVRPLVVIDPEDREQVERLAKAMHESDHIAPWHDLHNETRAQIEDAMQAALREFAAPTPAKPDEPLTGGSQVREADGTIWTRVEGQPNRPWVYSGSDATYAALDVVEVLR